jgi:hypothetical protein
MQVFVSSDLVSLKKENNKSSHLLCLSIPEQGRSRGGNTVGYWLPGSSLFCSLSPLSLPSLSHLTDSRASRHLCLTYPTRPEGKEKCRKD